MKIHLLTLATFILVATACSKTDTETPDTKGRTFTLTAALPADKPGSRVLLEEDGATPHGLVMGWESADKLHLNFKYNGTFYRSDAPIVPESISDDGTKASFTVTIPSEIPEAPPSTSTECIKKRAPGTKMTGGISKRGKTTTSTYARIAKRSASP